MVLTNVWRKISSRWMTLGAATRVVGSAAGLAVGARLAYAMADTITYPISDWPKIRTPAMFGFGIATGIATCVLLTSPKSRKLVSRSPRLLYSRTFRIVRNNQEVRDAIGESIKLGRFRSIYFIPGSINLNSITGDYDNVMNRLAALWVPREIRLSYLIQGNKGSGIVEVNDRHQVCRVILVDQPERQPIHLPSAS
uniref:Uncharacterized protein n=1 Tax=Spongospora subterranea TaxID=70186 RepID=A0A0H5R5S7_9EUKA|eukprot:CRZ09483.1 hypothetical protein [Spongospora subterranea]